MKRLLAQCRKELAQFRRDPITVGLAFVLPFVALLLFGFAIRLEIKNLPVAIISFDAGRTSREFVDRIFATGQFVPVKWSGTDPIKPLDSGAARAAIVIPPDFSRRVKAEKPVEVQAVVDATDVNNARVIERVMIGTTGFFMSVQHLMRPPAMIEPDIRLWFNPGRKESLYVVPGSIALVEWIFPSLLTAIAVTREKEQGTILQLYASDVSAAEVILGKGLAYWIIGMLEAIVVLIASFLLFGLEFVGNPLVFCVNTVLFVAAAVGFGLLCGSVASTQNAAVQMVATIGFTTTLLLSGFIYPIRNIAFPLSYLSNFVPARYFIVAARDTFVRNPDPFSHWYIPVAIGLAVSLFLLGSIRKLSRMQLSD